MGKNYRDGEVQSAACTYPNKERGFELLHNTYQSHKNRFTFHVLAKDGI